MANQWLRLWHDMPNDPKWRTIARVSGQSIALAQAVYIHLLVDASRNVTRGHVDVTTEDLASSLDVTEDQICKILEAFNGRVMEGNVLSGWDKRQPKREDFGSDESGAKSAAERKREQREREKERVGKEDVTQCHDVSRNVTLDKDKDKDKDKETEKDKKNTSDASASSPVRESKAVRFPDFWAVWPKSDRKTAKAKCEDRWRKQGLDQCADEIIAHVTACKLSRSWLEGFEPAPLRYLTERRWADGTDLTVAEYSADELDVFSRYNLILANAGWPEACADVYSSDRSEAILAFLGLGKKENWIDLYFDWLRESLEPRPGCGFDWVIRKDTFIRAREGNFSALKEAA